MVQFVDTLEELCDEYNLDRLKVFKYMYRTLNEINKSLSYDFYEEVKKYLICAKCGLYMEEEIDEIVHDEINPPNNVEKIISYYCPSCGEEI